MATSVPVPPSKVSDPVPPLSLSLPAAPPSVSLPFWPSRRSAPLVPPSVSLLCPCPRNPYAYSVVAGAGRTIGGARLIVGVQDRFAQGALPSLAGLPSARLFTVRVAAWAGLEA